jgi:hypothetical protein
MLVQLLTPAGDTGAAAPSEDGTGGCAAGEEDDGDADRLGDMDFGEEIIPQSTTQASPDAVADVLMRDWEHLRHTDGIDKRTAEDISNGVTLTPKYILRAWPMKRLYEYWKEHGQKNYPEMAKVAMAVFAEDGAAAEIERDFCLASQLITKDRASLDPAWVEMIMFLRLLIGGKKIVLPDHFKDLQKLVGQDDEGLDAIIQSTIPDRLTDADKQEAIADLDSDVDEEEDIATDRYIGHWDAEDEDEDYEAVMQVEEAREDEDNEPSPVKQPRKRGRKDGDAAAKGKKPKSSQAGAK